MSKSKEWACEHGCDLSTGVICPHLEALLPSSYLPPLNCREDQSSSSIDFFTLHFWKHDEDAFISLMRNYGFMNEWDLDLLSAKYFRNLSVRDIEKEFNWISKSAVQRKLKELRDLLKERGFEQERS